MLYVPPSEVPPEIVICTTDIAQSMRWAGVTFVQTAPYVVSVTTKFAL